MLLDRIDIDSHGPLTRIGLGPFSQQLNVVSAPPRSGKTALVRFLRDSLTGTTPAYDGMAQSRGRVVWAAADGLYHCRREPNGTAQGRRFVDFESRLGGHAANHFNRPPVIVDLPASIVDGVVTDTSLTSVQRVVRSIIDSGLDRGSAGADHELHDELAALRAEIARLQGVLQTKDSAVDTAAEHQARQRLAALALELRAVDSQRQFARQSAAAMQRVRRDQESLARAADEVNRLRAIETDLRKRIATLDQTRAELRDQAASEEQQIALVGTTRVRVHWLNQQIQRLRRVLVEARALGDDWFGSHLHGGRSVEKSPAYGNQTHDANRFENHSLETHGFETHAIQVNGHEFNGHALPAPVGLPARDELETRDRGWLAAHRGATTENAQIRTRLDSLCQLADYLAGRLAAEQEHWSRGTEPVNVFDGLLSESDRALERMRAPGSLADWPRPTEADPHWIADSLRRRRIDALRRADARRRLDQSTDCQWIQGRPENALLTTLQAIGAALHSVSSRLRTLRAQHTVAAETTAYPVDASRMEALLVEHTAAAPLSPSERAEALRRCESDLVAALRRLTEHRAELLRRFAQTQKLPEGLLQAMTADRSALPAAVDRWLCDKLLSGKSDMVSNHPDAAVISASYHDRQQAVLQAEQQLQELHAELQQTIERMNQKLAEAESLRAQVQVQSAEAGGDDQELELLRGRIEAEIQRLNHWLAAPIRSAALDRYRRCQERLESLEARQRAASTLIPLASSYLEQLSGGRLRRVAWQVSINPDSGRRQIVATIDSAAESRCSVADRFLAALAVRMAAADELAHRGRPLPLVIETLSVGTGPAADGLFDLQTRGVLSDIDPVVTTLAAAAQRGRQIIVLTEDQRFAGALAGVGSRCYAIGSATPAVTLPLQDANRRFDIQWRETHGVSDLPEDFAAAWQVADEPQGFERSGFDRLVDDAADRGRWDQRVHHRGAPAAYRSESLVREAQNAARDQRPSSLPISFAQRGGEERRQETIAFSLHAATSNKADHAAGPFFLTLSSPIEQSPSIDVLSATRLRTLGITTVSQLLMSSPQELAGQMQMADVNTATVRRWQNECRLTCGVPGLRGFDARVLVGCGLVHPRELAEHQPAELLEKVEAFLATPRGAEILRTGTSHEVARLTGWIAEARRTVAAAAPAKKGANAQTQKPTRGDAAAVARVMAEPSDRPQRRGQVRSRAHHPADSRQPQTSGAGRDAAEPKRTKFFLHRHSNIVDAPSIGPRMAERLASVKISTVDDLLKAKPAALAAALGHRRVDASLIRAWQQQCILVCRVPRLRGHDAQLLVAAGITEPERLAQCDPKWLLTQIDPISRSREGQKILRGGQQPDLTEVTNWVRFAKEHRELRAA